MKLFSFFLILVTSFSYNTDKTIHFLHLAQNSYCSDDSLINWNCKLCENTDILENIIDNNGARALIGYSSSYNSLFVSFRGSENIQNWIDNIHIGFVYPYTSYNETWNNIGIEKGFYNVYQYIKDDILKKINELSYKYKTNQIITTGHSLGGISTIFSFEISNFYPDFVINHDITFGSPRIGNKEFTNMFKLSNIPSYRITHYYDMVPHLPQELLNYHHILGEVWFNEKNTMYQICDDYIDEDDECSNSCGPLKCTSIDDHLNYLNISMGSDGDC